MLAASSSGIMASLCSPRHAKIAMPYLVVFLAVASLVASQEGAGPAASDPPPSWAFANSRLRTAYVALQTWKRTAIFSDPGNFTGSWVGPDVCAYRGVYCAPLPGDGRRRRLVVAGIDLNHADIAGYLPESLPRGLPDLGLIHLNSNRFCGVVPDTFRRLRLLHELDLSNNRFVGSFPEVVLSLPSLRYLDLRFNDFEGPIPAALFDRPLDAIFLNSNRLTRPIPANLGNSPASVVVLAHNRLGGCIPPSIGRMAETLNEVVLIADELTGCVPPEVGLLRKVTVFDVSGNHLQGPLPWTVAGMAAVEELDVAGNRLEGAIPSGVCGLRSLKNFTYADNFFTSRPGCAAATADGGWNCIPGAPAQRPPAQCAAAAAHPFDCSKAQCQAPPFASKPKERRVGGRSPPAPRAAPTRGTFRRFPPPPPSSSTTPSSPLPPSASSPSSEPMASPPTEHPGYVLPPPAPTPPTPPPPPTTHVPPGGRLPFPPVYGVPYASPPPPGRPYN